MPPAHPSKSKTQSKHAPALPRSSAAEYLTFIAAAGGSESSVEMRYEDENVWLTQKMMGTLYDVKTHTINYHLKKIFDDNELQFETVIRNFRITAADGKIYDTQHYNLKLQTTALKHDNPDVLS